MSNFNPGYQKKVVRIPLETYKMLGNNVIHHPSGHFRKTIVRHVKVINLLACPPYTRKAWILSDPSRQNELTNLSAIFCDRTTSLKFLLLTMEN